MMVVMKGLLAFFKQRVGVSCLEGICHIALMSGFGHFSLSHRCKYIFHEFHLLFPTSIYWVT